MGVHAYGQPEGTVFFWVWYSLNGMQNVQNRRLVQPQPIEALREAIASSLC